MSNPRYTCRESALMFVSGWVRASAIASADLPAPVGPQMMRSASASAKSALDLVPRQLHDRAPAVDIVCRQRSGRERDEKRTHLARRQNITRHDRSLAREP